MKKKKLSKQQLVENQKNDDKKFIRTLIISFSLLMMSTIFVLTFYTFGCDTRFLYHKWVWYGNKIPLDWVCMKSDNLQLHKTVKFNYNEKLYYFCSQHCFDEMLKNYEEIAMLPDAFSGDSINKADALIGLKEKGKPELIYFKNKQTFNRYYEKNK